MNKLPTSEMISPSQSVIIFLKSSIIEGMEEWSTRNLSFPFILKLQEMFTLKFQKDCLALVFLSIDRKTARKMEN